MRIDYAFPVRHAEPLKGGALTAIGIEHRVIVTPTFPAQIRLQLIVALAVPHVDAQPDREHRMQARVLGPDLTELAPARAVNVRFTVGSDTPPGWEIRSTVPITIGFPAAVEGAYSVELSTDSHTHEVQVLVRGPRNQPPTA
jgi:hypothetical protein